MSAVQFQLLIVGLPVLLGLTGYMCYRLGVLHERKRWSDLIEQGRLPKPRKTVK